MGEDYYPKYYQKKKTRDRIFLNIWRVVIVLGLGIALGAILFSIVPISRKPMGVAELAEQKEQLEVGRDIDRTLPVAGSTNESQGLSSPPVSASLRDMRYVDSQPSVHVDIMGVSPGESQDPHMIIDDSPDSSGVTPVPDSTDSGDTSTDVDRLSRDNPSSASADEQQKPARQEVPVKVEEQADSEQTSASSAASEEKSKPDEKPKEEPDKVALPKGSTVYRVFAGYYDSKEEAVSRKKDLSTLGFSGSVQEGAGTFTIFVSQFSESDKAKALENKLEQNGFPASFIVRATN